MKRALAVLAICGVLAGVAVVMRAAGVQSDKENVVASRLEGKWRLHAELTKRLTKGEAVNIPLDVCRGFTSDPAVAENVPEKFLELLKGKQIFMAGMLQFTIGREKREHPFILTEYKGNPRVFYFREGDGDPMGNMESFNVMLAVAKDKANDLLFVGGDFNNQPFLAFERSPDEEKQEDNAEKSKDAIGK